MAHRPPPPPARPRRRPPRPPGKPPSGRSRDTEEAFLAGYDLAAFPRPSVTVDVVLLTVDRTVPTSAPRLHAVAYERTEHPDRHKHALPGGFVRLDESLDQAAARILRDKAGLEGLFVEQLYTFGAPQRDPRGRVLTVAYYALVGPERLADLALRSSARVHLVDVPWAGETGGPVDLLAGPGEPLPLAFDHADILGMAVKRLRGKLDYTPVGFQLLPAEFTLRALQDVHEAVRGETVNKDSFRRRMLAGGMLEATGEREPATYHRPAELYRFVKRSSV